MHAWLRTVPNAAAAPTTMTDVNVSGLLPSGETVVGATASQNAPGSSVQIDGLDNLVSADLGAIAPGANATLTITALVKTSAGATLDNTDRSARSQRNVRVGQRHGGNELHVRRRHRPDHGHQRLGDHQRQPHDGLSVFYRRCRSPLA
jgi:hypothetical protein